MKYRSPRELQVKRIIDPDGGTEGGGDKGGGGKIQLCLR